LRAVVDRWNGFTRTLLARPSQDSNASIALEDQVLGQFSVTL
jgi:hypothetical protein